MRVCDPDTAPDHELLLLVTAADDTVLDVRLGPVAEGQHHVWQVQLATDRANRCLVAADYWLANQTPCSDNKFDQPRVSVAPRGRSFLRFAQCAREGVCSNQQQTDDAATSNSSSSSSVSPPHRCEQSPLPVADQTSCQETAVILARDCSKLTIERLQKNDKRIVKCPIALNQQGIP